MQEGNILRGKLNHLKLDNNTYGYRSLSNESEKRLDLNDLLKRVERDKNKNKKINLLIFSGATSAIIVFFFLLSF